MLTWYTVRRIWFVFRTPKDPLFRCSRQQMNRDFRTWRNALALTLITGLPVLSCAIPILDLMVGDGTHAMEAEHHPETHGFAHDHLICIQQQANQWVVPNNDLLLRVVAAISLPEPSDPDSGGWTSQVSLPYSRAPPA